ncbi:hypothetical protein K438DRAFT_565867 [Mycena galopus ATCC 62051]|nr:hypothetical protein K438DRAFT_565867 [Mycena galopus ATCC 62051]
MKPTLLPPVVLGHRSNPSRRRHRLCSAADIPQTSPLAPPSPHGVQPSATPLSLRHSSTLSASSCSCHPNFKSPTASRQPSFTMESLRTSF